MLHDGDQELRPMAFPWGLGRAILALVRSTISLAVVHTARLIYQNDWTATRWCNRDDE